MGEIEVCAAFLVLEVAIGLHQPFARLAQLGFNQTKEILFLLLSYNLHHYPQIEAFISNQEDEFRFQIQKQLNQSKIYICMIIQSFFSTDKILKYIIHLNTKQRMTRIEQFHYLRTILDLKYKQLIYFHTFQHKIDDLSTQQSMKWIIIDLNISYYNRLRFILNNFQQKQLGREYMPRYTIIEQPLQNQKKLSPRGSPRKANRNYHLQLINILQKNGKRNKLYNNDPPARPNYQNNSYEQTPPQRYMVVPNEDHSDPNLNQTRVYLPKIKRKYNLGNSATYNVIDHEKLALRKYMNEKLVFIKKPTINVANMKKNKRSHTLDHELKPYKNSYEYSNSRGSKTPIQDKQQKLLIKQPNENGKKYLKVYQVPRRVDEQRLEKNQRRRSQSNPQLYLRDFQFKRSSNNDIMKQDQDIQLETNSNYPSSKDSPKRNQNLIKQPENFANRKQSRYQQQKFHKNSQQEQRLIDPLNLQTYFIKMKKKSKEQKESVLRTQRQKLKIPQIPKREDMSRFIRNYQPEFKQINIEQLINSKSFQIITDDVNGKRTFYFGQTFNEKRHGKGIIITQKSFFEGIWADDEKIRGIQQTEAGKYKGEFRDGQRSGNGEFFWSHGEYYSGQWKNGKKSGSGYWRSPKGESYMGEWTNGQVTGSGIHILSQGQRYQGQFVNFLKHGYGYEEFPNGDRYEGRYVQGQAHGKGKYYWKNGTFYNGDFLNGFREGRGVISAPNRLQFEGRFKKEIIYGIGYLRLGNGDIYNGMFEDNKMNGHGVFDMKSQGKVLKGVWQNNQLIRLEQ